MKRMNSTKGKVKTARTGALLGLVPKQRQSNILDKKKKLFVERMRKWIKK